MLVSFLHLLVHHSESFQALSVLVAPDTPVDAFPTLPQLDSDLITLTLLPRSRWQSLLNLEVIQVCGHLTETLVDLISLLCLATK